MSPNPPLTARTYMGRIVSRLAPQAASYGSGFGPPTDGGKHIPLRPSAVLVPIVVRPEPTVLFTRRTEHLPSHAGQISFPGGRVASGEAALDTALRETHEETGITRDFIDVAGYLNLYSTATGFAIQPVVAFLREGFALEPNPAEVAEIFELPLGFLMTRANYQLKTRDMRGTLRTFHELTFGAYTVWGATAAMLVDLCERLGDAS